MPKCSEVEINLKEFNMNWIRSNKVILFIGKRDTGKSILVKDFLFHNQDIPFATCISPTDSFNLTFVNHIPSRFIFEEYNTELIEGFLKRQKNITRKTKLAQIGKGDLRYKDVDPRGLLLMDDCLADAESWKDDKNIKWIFMNGRHVNATLIMTMQYQLGIPPSLRNNIDYVFLCKETKLIEKQKLHKYFAGIFPTFDMFNQIFTQCTSNYGCMVIDNTSQKEEIENQVYWYKADIHKEFRICLEDFWHNNEDYMKDDILDTKEGTNTEKKNDDYYKYTSTRGKTKYNMNIERNDDR